jgi:2-polyprenyl-3-methyl-5-hydroxy-6-metoxy-1,4-benzoquinol methylase
MDTHASGRRKNAFGSDYESTLVDRFGQWLSSRRVRRTVRGFAGKAIGDFGCGFHADVVRSALGEVASATLVDIAIAPDLKRHPRVIAMEGTLPDVLEQVPTASLDVVICNSVLEHLWEPQKTMRHIRRSLRQGGIAFLNVPSWRGRIFLETAAFRLHVSSAMEMDDHKRYYSTNELWTLLVEGGFRPMEIIRCGSHKFGLNTFAECKVL